MINELKKTGIIFFVVVLCSFDALAVFSKLPFIQTTADSITTEIIINNDSIKDISCSYTQHLADAEGKTVYRLDKVPFTITAGKENKVVITQKPLGIKLWSPESPYLYKVATTVEIAGRAPIAYENNIGFRTFEIRGCHFYLNGKPYFLRGLSRIPPGRVHDPDNNKRPDIWRDEAFVHDYFKKLKDANINIIRICGSIDKDMIWVDYADKMGVMLVNGSYSGEGALGDDVINRNRSTFVPVIKAVRNHTSPAIYTLSNELKWNKNPAFLPGVRENYKVAKSLDSSRLIIGNAGFGEGKAGDIEDLHDYLGWYYGSMTSFSRYMKKSSKVDYRAGKGTNKPITFTEMVGTYTNNRDGKFHVAYNKHHANALRLVGTSDKFAEDSMWYQSLITKEMVESMRRARGAENRICGTFPFSTYWFWDIESKTAKNKPAVDSLKMAYSPVLLSMNTWNRNFYAGDRFSSMLYVVNDDVQLGLLKGAKLQLDLVQGGEVINTNIVDLPEVEYYDTKKLRVDIQIPSIVKAGKALVTAKLIHPKANCQGNRIDIFVAPKDFAEIDQKGRLHVFDPKGKTISNMQKLGFSVVPMKTFESINPQQRLVVASGAFAKETEISVEKFWQFIKDGGRALVLEQNDSIKSGLLPDGLKLKKTNELFVNIDRNTNHILLDGLRYRDLFAFNNIGSTSTDSYTVKYAFDVSPDALDMVEVVANCGQHLRRAVVIECFTGKGSVIFSQIECLTRASKDPVADKVFSNLIRTLIDSDNLFAEQTGWDVKFSDFDSERGLFAAPLQQGIILNSHNYGRVTYGDTRGSGWGALFADGRRVVGPQKITRSLGYISTIDEDAKQASGFFWARPPKDANAASLQVVNPTKLQLSFKVFAGQTKAIKYTVKANTNGTFGPFPFKRSNNGAVKFTIETALDTEGTGKKKKLVEELVFKSLTFSR